ncbi:ABC transporter ATP-binding protein [Curtanaerobium respiraculi]|uniref:ABC transporter ATP-binding protein n=1 Tax=Curtanaerobium respiraculi TaxID=2949669 RepID=UPI0024B34183|nr:ABC transporter ATP-binding protein [Curtanaerobium respiraculi]
MILEVRDVCAGYRGIDVVHDVSFQIESGEVLCLLGPNGVGKTTLFKSLLGFIPFSSGGLYIDGHPLDHRDRKEMASFIGYVPQVHEPPFPFVVIDVVVMGSISRSDPFAGPSRKAFEEADALLELLDISYLRDRIYTEISGGERQMVLIARALMQNPAFLMMDEPTSSLDFGNQMRVLAQIRALSQRGMGIIMTSHFPDHAFLCCDKAAVMSRTKPFRIDAVEKIVTEETLRDAYGIPVKIAAIDVPEHPDGSVTTCVPLLKTKDGPCPRDGGAGGLSRKIMP